jgi:hypothetical protein
MKNLLILGLTTVLFGCASLNYHQTDKWKKNNTVTIKSENLNDFSIYVDGKNIGIQKIDKSNIIVTKYSNRNRPENIKSLILLNSSSDYNLTFNGFKNKDIKASLYNQNYEKIDLIFQKRVRYDALTKDIFCSVLTFGIPFLIDPFKSDFYRIKKSSSNHKIRFEYTQEYMKNEYLKIQSSTNIVDFKNWLSNYPRSLIYQKVIDHRDSLEFSFAFKQQKESAIEEFISTHINSKYLESAITVKNEMKTAREMFQTAKTINTIEAFESFLNKFSNSLHITEARKLLVDAAEKEAFSSLNSEKVLSYLSNYLIPNEIFLDKNTILEKRKKTKNNLEAFLIQENIKNNNTKNIDEYSSLWKRYVSIIEDNRILSDIKNFEKIQNHQVEICDLLFNSLKEADSEEKQIKWKEKTMIDFPKLNIVNNLPTEPENILFTVIDNQRNGNGLIKIFNDNYFQSLNTDSRIDNGLIAKYNSGEYEYKSKKYNALENSVYQELNFLEGSLNGMSKAFNGPNLLFSLRANIEDKITDEISFYQEGKLVKTIYISKGFTAEGDCIIENDFSYEFENGVNLTLINFEKEITKLENESKTYMHLYDTQIAIKECNRLKKYNIPDDVQNARIEKIIASAEEFNETWKKSIARNDAINRAKLRSSVDNNINKETENSDLSKKIKSVYCITMKGEKFKVILYESGECDYVLFNIFGEIQKSLSGKWTMRNLGVYGGWTTTITFEHGSSTFKCQMNGSGDIQALIDDQGNFWLKCI